MAEMFVVITEKVGNFDIHTTMKFFRDKDEAIKYASHGKETIPVPVKGRCIASFKHEIEDSFDQRVRHTHVFPVEEGREMVIPHHNFSFAWDYWDEYGR